MPIRHPLADSHRPRLLITGASTRAAAWSAIRAGFFPVCADRFGDEDLRQIAEVHDEADVRQQLQSGKAQFVTAARMAVSEPTWNLQDYFTRFENPPRIERNLTSYLGCRLGPEQQVWMRGIADITQYLRSANLPALNTRPGGSWVVATDDSAVPVKWLRGFPPKADGKWVLKPIWGGGGRSVQIWDNRASRQTLWEPTYFQEFRDGQPMSAIFVANPQATSPVELIGLTEQIIGDITAAAPTRFTYCGNIAPVSLPDEATSVVMKIGAVLAEKLGLRGIFGVDFIWDGTTPWVIEVNPRYTASCELLELVLGRALLRDHWQAWLPNDPLPSVTEPPSTVRPGVLGKLILYARSQVTAPDLGRFLRRRPEWTVPWLADIPRIGTSFLSGEPLCTVFATGRDAAQCRRKLVRRARRVRNWFGDWPDPFPEPS